jgi:hypothetical protein
MIEYNHKGMTIASLHDERTGSFQYVVVDEATKVAAIIDPVLDFDPRAGATATDNADMILEYVREASYSRMGTRYPFPRRSLLRCSVPC